jgi:hypothetical protein
MLVHKTNTNLEVLLQTSVQQRRSRWEHMTITGRGRVFTSGDGLGVRARKTEQIMWWCKGEDRRGGDQCNRDVRDGEEVTGTDAPTSPCNYSTAVSWVSSWGLDA